MVVIAAVAVFLVGAVLTAVLNAWMTHRLTLAGATRRMARLQVVQFLEHHQYIGHDEAVRRARAIVKGWV